jgi:hypothetical protein
VKNQHRLCLVLLAFLLGAGAVAHAADDSLKKASQLLERHYYESAAATLRAATAGTELAPVAALMLARAYIQNAQLYRLLQNSSLAIGKQYLNKLVAQKGNERSLYVTLYYGEYLAESGQSREGVAQLKNFIAQKDSAPNYRDTAQMSLLAAQNTAKPAPRSADPLVRSQYAAALSRIPASRAEAVVQIDQALAEMLKTNPIVPVRAMSNAIAVYARSGQSGKALALLASADLGRPSYEEVISKTKALRFYDPALLGNLAELFEAEAQRLLLRLQSNARLKPVAKFFLLNLYLNTGEFNKAAALLPELLDANSDLPAAYRERVLLLQAASDVRSGQAARGNAVFAELGRKYEQDPALLAQVLQTCVRVKASCASVTASARALAQTSQGERFRSLHHAVGEQYAADGRNEQALLSMETARDKSNKNRIDTNDPVLLVHLADLYFIGKSFSESLEIYFELSKEFPAVRQLQESAQGVYSTEYRSAGDVKIF